jgi:hypothetical protein
MVAMFVIILRRRRKGDITVHTFLAPEVIGK